MKPQLDEIKSEAQCKEQELKPERDRIQSQIAKELKDNAAGLAELHAAQAQEEEFRTTLQDIRLNSGARRLQRCYRHLRLKKQVMEEEEEVVSRATILVN